MPSCSAQFIQDWILFLAKIRISELDEQFERINNKLSAVDTLEVRPAFVWRSTTSRRKLKIVAKTKDL